MKQKDDMETVKKAIKGNKEAYGDLISKYQVYLYKTAFMYMKNESDALDAVQECAIKGMLGIEKLREPLYFKTWITRILMNCVYKNKKDEQDLLLLKDDQGEVRSNYLIDEKIDMYDVIDSLRKQYKTVVILYYFQELKIKEIAKIMDIPEGSVKVYLHRAKKEIKKKLSEEEVSNYAK